jgi:DNA invertase Pin-like site-specific DNA recombinase
MLVGYARVSTQDQKLELQMDALKEAGCERIFEDKASGTKAARPGLNEALAFMRPGDTLVIWKLSRLGRSLTQQIETVQAMQDKGIELKSLNESIDTRTPTGKLLFHIVAAFAQFERDNMIENTKAGLEEARARGKKGGRKPVLEGKRLAQAKVLRADTTLPIADICKTLGISRATLYRYTTTSESAASD